MRPECAGRNFFSKSINVQTQIRPCRGEFLLKINKRACTSIRYTRVCMIVWQHFILDKEKEKAKCKHCGKEFRSSLRDETLSALVFWKHNSFWKFCTEFAWVFFSNIIHFVAIIWNMLRNKFSTFIIIALVNHFTKQLYRWKALSMYTCRMWLCWIHFTRLLEPSWDFTVLLESLVHR